MTSVFVLLYFAMGAFYTMRSIEYAVEYGYLPTNDVFVYWFTVVVTMIIVVPVWPVFVAIDTFNSFK